MERAASRMFVKGVLHDPSVIAIKFAQAPSPPAG
jgi:hypothetical protein